MDADRERLATTFLSGLVLGAVIGAGISLLTAPRPGRRTRRRLRRAALGARDRAGDTFETLAADVRGRVDEAFELARQRLDG